MEEIFIVGAARTPIGKFGGTLGEDAGVGPRRARDQQRAERARRLADQVSK
jgi:acetyl-CoA acetyltransferase